MITRKNNKGSALVWGVVISSVLVILIGASLTMAFSFYNKSMMNNNKKQAYFTARSVVDTMSGEIQNETENGKVILDRLINVGDVVNLDNINFSDEFGNLGTTFAFAKLSDTDSIEITATTTVSGQSKSVTAILGKGTDGGTSLPIGEDFPDLIIPDEILKVTSGESVSISNSEEVNIYVQSGATISFSNNADYSGIIYTEAGVAIGISQGSKFWGDIYAQSDTIFSFNKLHKFFVGKIYVKNGAVINVNGVDYTITQNDGSISIYPNYIDSNFRDLLVIYTGTGTGGDGWGDTVYE